MRPSGCSTNRGASVVWAESSSQSDAKVMHRLAEVWRPGGDGPPGSKTINESGGKTGGEAGIRTLGTGLSPYNGLANRRLQPLGHLTVSKLLKNLRVLQLLS